MLSSLWQLEDVGDVEALIASVVDGYLAQRGAYLRPDLREDLDAYLIGRTWELYKRFDPSKAKTKLSLSTYLTRRLTYAITDWYRNTFTDNRRKANYIVQEVLSLDVEGDEDLEPGVEVELSSIATMNSTTRDRFDRYVLRLALGQTKAQIAALNGVTTAEVTAELNRLREQLRD